MSDLRQRVPGHSLIEQLLREWDLGNIHVGQSGEQVVIDDEAMGWYLGVHGERWVATRLALLGPEYTVLHSVPVGRGDSDIDHVVIGPAGVFTINTKYSPGKRVWSAGYGIYVGGREEKHFIRNMDLEVRRAGAKLSRATGIAVNPMGLIVFVDPSRMDRKGPAGDGTIDIRVISDAELISTIGDRPVLMPHEFVRLAEAAARPETWHDAPNESTIGSHIAQEFIALEAAVGPLAPIRSEPARPSAPRAARATRPVTAPRPQSSASRAFRSAPARPRSRRRSSGRKSRSMIEGLVVAAVFIGLGYFLTRPEGQAWFSALFTPLFTR